MFTFPKRKGAALWILASLIAPSFLFAQQPRLNLSALIDSADHYLPTLQEKQALLNSASANVTDARHQFLPAFRLSDQLTLGSDNSLAGSYFSYGIVPSSSSGVRAANDMQAASGNIAILYGQYDLIDFGYRNARIDEARAEENFQHADLAREIYIQNSRVSRAYFHLLIAEARIAVEQQTVSRYDTIFSTIRGLTGAGIKPGSDSSLAKAELSKSRITYNQLNGLANNYRQELAYLTGIDPGRLEIDTTLLFQYRRLALFNGDTSAATNPLIDYYQNLQKTYQANEKLIARSYLPRISLTAASWARGSSIVYDDQYKGLPTGWGLQRFNYIAGLSFQYDLFNGLHKKDQLRSFGFEREASELELKQQILNLDFASKRAQNDIEITERNLLELPIQYQAAVDTYNQKMAQYKAGIITLIDLTNAAFVLDRSLNDYVETVGSWYLAKLEQSIAGGNLATFIQSL